MAAPRRIFTSSESVRKVSFSIPPHPRGVRVVRQRQRHRAPVGSHGLPAGSPMVALERLRGASRRAPPPIRPAAARRTGRRPRSERRGCAIRGKQGPPLERLEGRGGGGAPELQPAPGEVVDPGASRQLLEAPQGVAVVGGGVDQDLLGPIEQARVRDRRTGVGKPQDGGQVAEQERRQERGGVLQARVVRRSASPGRGRRRPGRRRRAARTRARPRRRAGRSRAGAGPASATGCGRRARRERRRPPSRPASEAGATIRFRVRARACPRPTSWSSRCRRSSSADDLLEVDVLAPPPAALGHRPPHTCLQLRPRTASSSSASGGPWLPAS